MNRISTVDEYMNKMALLSTWGARNNVSIAKVPKGTNVRHAIGFASEKTNGIEQRVGRGKQLLFEKFNDKWVIDTKKLYE